MKKNNIYIEKGYKNRADYLDHLADNYGVPSEVVQNIAEILGPNEDFDGLVTAMEDGLDSGMLSMF